MKRSCCSILPACLKLSPAARRGLELSRLTIIKAIAVPLVIVAVDVASDGSMLYFMPSDIDDTLTKTRINIFSDTTYTPEQYKPVLGQSGEEFGWQCSHLCPHGFQRDGIKGCPCAHRWLYLLWIQNANKTEFNITFNTYEPSSSSDINYCYIVLALSRKPPICRSNACQKNWHTFVQIISHEMTWESTKASASHRTSLSYNGCSTSSLCPMLWKPMERRPPPASTLTEGSYFHPSNASIFSLSMGQFKVLLGHKLLIIYSKVLNDRSLNICFFEYSPFCLLQAHNLTTEYSTTFVQKIVYFLAAFGKELCLFQFVKLMRHYSSNDDWWWRQRWYWHWQRKWWWWEWRD